MCNTYKEMENFKTDLEAIRKGNAIYDKYITKN